MPNSEAVASAANAVAEQIAAQIPAAVAKKSWYAVNRKAGDDEAEISIYDAIGAFGVTAADFVAELKTIDAKRINLRLNTPGGEVFDATAIYNAIAAHPARVVAHIDGVAASAGSYIAMSGDQIRMADNAYLMIHNARGGVMGEADEMRNYAGMLDKMNDNIAGIYERRAGKNRAHWRGLMDAETWFTAEEAKAEGLVDEVYAASAAKSSARASFDFRAYNKIPDAVAAMWGIQKKTVPEDPSRDGPPPANHKETQPMADESTKAAPATPPAAPGNGSNPQDQTPEQQIANLRNLTAAGYVEQGKRLGVEEGRRLERERLDSIVAVCPGKPQLAIDTFRSGKDSEVAKLAYDAENRADARARDIEKTKDLEIQRLNALLANVGSPGVVLDLAGVEDYLPQMEPKAQAEWEWENKPDVRKTARSKDIYVIARTAELDGTHRSFSRASAN